MGNKLSWLRGWSSPRCPPNYEKLSGEDRLEDISITLNGSLKEQLLSCVLD